MNIFRLFKKKRRWQIGDRFIYTCRDIEYYLEVEYVFPVRRCRQKDLREHLLRQWSTEHCEWISYGGFVLNAKEIEEHCREIPPLTRLILWGEVK